MIPLAPTRTHPILRNEITADPLIAPFLFQQVPLVVKRLKILSEVSDLDALCIDDINNIAKSVSIKHSGKKKKSEKKESELLVTPKGEYNA